MFKLNVFFRLPKLTEFSQEEISRTMVIVSNSVTSYNND